MLGDRCDLTVANGNVPHGTDVVFCVDNVATLQKQIVLVLSETRGGRENY